MNEIDLDEKKGKIKIKKKFFSIEVEEDITTNKEKEEYIEKIFS